MADGSRGPIEVSIVVINWNVSDLLRRCIDAVLATAGDVSWEMFVIDNDSRDMDFDLVAAAYAGCPHLCFLRNPANEGGVAVNRVHRRARGRYLLLLGPDAVLMPGSLRALVDFMDRGQAGAATAKLLNPDGSPQMYYYRLWSLPMVFWVDTLLGAAIDRLLLGRRRRRHYLGLDVPVDRVTRLEQPPGACLILRREALEEDEWVIDPAFPFYFNDVDLCLRLQARGWGIYLVPEARVVHDHCSSFRKADPCWARREYLASQLRFFQKWYPERVSALRALLAVDLVMTLVLWPVLAVDRLLCGQKRFRRTTFLQELSVLGHLVRARERWAGAQVLRPAPVGTTVDAEPANPAGVGVKW